MKVCLNWYWQHLFNHLMKKNCIHPFQGKQQDYVMCIKFEEIINGLEHKKICGEAERIINRMKETKAIFS